MSAALSPPEKLERRVHAYMEKLEPAVSGQHGHTTLLRAAAVLVYGFGLSPDHALPYALDYNSRCMPPWSERELRRKLCEALRKPDKRPRGYLLGEESLGCSSEAPQQLAATTPAWPKPNLEAIDTIVRSGWTLCDLWESSPVRFEDDESKAEDIIDILFPGDPLLCCAKSNHKFATRRREVWRGKLSELPLIVPNPMLAVNGATQGGWLSEHSKSATGRRVYQCIEFDFSEKAKDGFTDTIWAPPVRGWKADGIEVTDACAALIFHLKNLLPTLAVVCFSGGKSLHAWFRVFEVEPSEQRKFMNRAVELGADRATWSKAQLVRIPDGQRASGVRQVAYYFDPAKAVTK
jgi:hypothetical protein